jgi:hypothetical protein
MLVQTERAVDVDSALLLLTARPPNFTLTGETFRLPGQGARNHCLTPAEKFVYQGTYQICSLHVKKDVLEVRLKLGPPRQH